MLKYNKATSFSPKKKKRNANKQDPQDLDTMMLD